MISYRTNCKTTSKVVAILFPEASLWRTFSLKKTVKNEVAVEGAFNTNSYLGPTESKIIFHSLL